MVNSTEFAKRLQKILDFYGLSATAFSDQIDFNRSTISHLLSGRNKPSLEFVMKVLHEFPEVELYWLLNGKGSFPAIQNPLDSISNPIPSSGGQDQEPMEPVRQNAPDPVPDIRVTPSDKEIDRIVIFYTDGTFSSYR